MSMKKRILSTLLALVAVSLALYAFVPESQNRNEDIPQSEDIVIVCRCSESIWQNNKCKVTNDGEICAMSEPNQNIMCGDYKSNCARYKRIFKSISGFFSKLFNRIA